MTTAWQTFSCFIVVGWMCMHMHTILVLYFLYFWFLKFVIWKGSIYIKLYEFHSLAKVICFFPFSSWFTFMKPVTLWQRSQEREFQRLHLFYAKQYLHKGVVLVSLKTEHNQKHWNTFEKDVNWRQILLHKWTWLLPKQGIIDLHDVFMISEKNLKAHMFKPGIAFTFT